MTKKTLPPFKSMIDRLARTTQFKTFGDVLRNAMVAEYKRKRKGYPAFIRAFKRKWGGYNANQIAKCIKDNTDLVFKTWFSGMFYFDPKRLQILEPNTRSDVDFNAKFHYLFTEDEVRFIEAVIDKYKVQSVKPLVVMNQLIITGLRLLGPIIQEFFTRPYDFQPENVQDEDVPGGKLVKIFFSSREA
ncbi:MAG: hypothetical protein JW839_22970 [Candidatus Lokiarchaeota archaeon]|nr:hypothetical protein [Candidatus Lokiarchaeota archaeon]